jgi:sugar lactone lactonase YvrE
VKKYLTSALAAGLFLCAGNAWSQQAATAQAPDMNYQSVPNFFKTPAGDYMGETQGVATNSKGDIFIFFRGEHSRLWQFDKNGTFIREIGKNYYGFLFAHSVRVDVHDNIWAVDEGANLVTEFNPDGSKVLMVLGHRPKVTDGVVATPHGPNPPDTNYTFCRPTDVAWDGQGNIFIADGYCNNRVLKYDPNGRFLAKVGGNLPGKGNEEFSLPHALQVDRQGNVYVADRGNNRIQVYDYDLNYKKTFTGIGAPWSVQVTPKYIYSGDGTGKIYRLDHDGKLLGWVQTGLGQGQTGCLIHELHAVSDTVLIKGACSEWTVEKITFK